MAARAYWKGFLRLSLVSIAVEIYNAVESKSEISFRQIHKPSGRRINYTKTVQGIGEVKSSDIVKGYEVDSDTYVTLEPDEIEAVKLESKKTIDLVKFFNVDDIDPRYFERPYYVGPGDKLLVKASSSSGRPPQDRQGRAGSADHRWPRVADRRQPFGPAARRQGGRGKR
jgi:DNA end-binding protein Ku